MKVLQEAIRDLKDKFQEESQKIVAHMSASDLEGLRVRWSGKKGVLASLFEKLAQVEKADKPQAGQLINDFKNEIEHKLTELKQTALELAFKKKLEENLDISLPVTGFAKQGSLHPVTLIQQRILDIFKRYGFSIFDGPELDFDFYNFSALNIPSDHPARDMQDTFFLNDEGTVLRTQTSNVQIHAMLQEKPPLRFVSPGRVFRVDSDATHTPMFHQLECVIVDKGISFAHLKGIINAFLVEVFGPTATTRFRPSYFPFVEPGAEVDMRCVFCAGKGCRTCKQSGWIEIGGCGVIHPNVFESVQYDSEEYSGVAFGFGLDRMAMLAFGLPDLRQLFEGDVEFHTQFPIFSGL